MSNQVCRFCRRDNGMVFCHGHYHCAKCGLVNYECCTGEREEDNEELDYDDGPMNEFVKGIDA